MNAIEYIQHLLIPIANAQVTAPQFRNRFRFNTTNANVNTLFNYVVVVINWFLVIVAVLAFIYLVIYGIQYITSGGDAAKATTARNAIINAIIGIIVIVLAFFIINVAVNFGNQPVAP